jgi:hypothetical protein
MKSAPGAENVAGGTCPQADHPNLLFPGAHANENNCFRRNAPGGLLEAVMPKLDKCVYSFSLHNIQ